MWHSSDIHRWQKSELSLVVGTTMYKIACRLRFSIYVRYQTILQYIAISCNTKISGRPALMTTINKQTVIKEIILFSKPPKTWVNYELKIKKFTETGGDTVAKVMRNLVMKPVTYFQDTSTLSKNFNPT